VNGYLVDTNIPSELTHDFPDDGVIAFLRRTPRDRVFLSVMTIGEICKGIALLPDSRRRTTLQTWLNTDVRTWYAGRILPVTEVVAERWGQLASAAKQRGLTLPVVDGVIAATALHHQLILVTRNTKDFAGLGVEILNPWN
jgi:predicted nucleic acid-binding protein